MKLSKLSIGEMTPEELRTINGGGDTATATATASARSAAEAEAEAEASIKHQ